MRLFLFSDFCRLQTKFVPASHSYVTKTARKPKLLKIGKRSSLSVGCHKEPNFWQAWYQLSQSILSSTKIGTFTHGWSPISLRRYSLGLWHCFYKPIAISKRFFHLNNKIYKNLYGWLWKSLKHKIIPAYRFVDCFPFQWFPFLLPRFDTANARQRNVIKQPIKIVRLLASLRRHYFRKN